MLDFSAWKNEDLIDALENGVEVEKTIATPGWRILDEAFKRLSLQADRELRNVPADKMAEITELQVIAKFYDNVFKSVVESYKQEGKLAFDECKQRDLEI